MALHRHLRHTGTHSSSPTPRWQQRPDSTVISDNSKHYSRRIHRPNRDELRTGTANTKSRNMGTICQELWPPPQRLSRQHRQEILAKTEVRTMCQHKPIRRLGHRHAQAILLARTVRRPHPLCKERNPVPRHRLLRVGPPTLGHRNAN